MRVQITREDYFSEAEDHPVMKVMMPSLLGQMGKETGNYTYQVCLYNPKTLRKIPSLGRAGLPLLYVPSFPPPPSKKIGKTLNNCSMPPPAGVARV